MYIPINPEQNAQALCSMCDPVLDVVLAWAPSWPSNPNTLYPTIWCHNLVFDIMIHYYLFPAICLD